MMDTDVTIGGMAPEIYFRGMDGTEKTLSQVRQPVTIIGFVAPSEGACDRADDRLAGISRRFWNLPVSVVQISEPTAKCPHGPGCVQTSGPGKHQVIEICDPNRTAWAGFGHPTDDTLFLLDANGEIVQTSSVNASDALVREAQKMAYENLELHAPRFGS
jgi:hypothetical protein